MRDDSLSKIFSGDELGRSLEAALLLKPTGIQVAGWTRGAVPQEVVSVMAATLWGSLETLLRALGGPAPRTAILEVEGRRLLAQRVTTNWTLLLIAPVSLGSRQLELEARRIVGRLSHLRSASAQPRATAISRT